MKQKNLPSIYATSILATIIFQSCCFAQSINSSVKPTPSPPAIIVTVTVSPTPSASPASKVSPIGAGYTGLFFGPGLSFNGKTKDNEALSINHRPNLKYNLNDDFTFGVQPRINQRFLSNKTVFEGGDSRLFANIKNLINSDTTSLTLIPRIILPLNNRAHNTHMLYAPEILASYDITPKNSRFSLALTPELIKWVYADQATPLREKGNDLDFTFNTEGSYTLTPHASLTFSYYPEWNSKVGTRITNVSNELDFGISYEFIKKWTINPTLSIEPDGFQAANATKNMGIIIVLNGTFI